MCAGNEVYYRGRVLNILLFHVDQHRADCLGVAGHPLLRTPHLDRFAAAGVRFTHAFTPCPVCVPARNSLLYGRWPTGHHVIANPNTEAPRPAPADLPTWSEALRNAGYFLGYVGKWHISQEKTPRDFGFHEYVPETGYTDWRAAQGLPPVPQEGDWFGNPDAPEVAPHQSRLAWGADQTIRLLEQAAAQGETPFFLRWDPAEPHLPCIPPEPYASMYAPEEIPPWLSFPDPLEGKPYIQRQMRRTWGVEDWSWEQWQPLVSRYLGTLSLLDAQVGRLLDTLDRLGLANNTLVVYTSDHGDTCGGHGMIDKHYVLYDDVTRVPLIARLPGGVQGAVCDAFVSNEVDLAATFCEAAGLPLLEGFQGTSLLPPLRGEAQTNGRDSIFTQYMGSQNGLYSQRMVRDHRWKYVFNAVAEDELYDLEADPGEIVNRALNPDCAGELSRLRARLEAWMESLNDPLLNAWTRPLLQEAGRKW